MKNNKKWFSIIIAMWLVVLISLLALSILEYIVPFSKNVKWIENSAGSYYRAVSAVENALWFVKPSKLWINNSTTMSITATWNNYSIIANWSILPPILKGNSEFNKDWNRISSWDPIQLEVWNNMITNWSTFNLFIKVPNIDWSSVIVETFSWAQNIIQWQLSSQSWSLNASGSYIKWNEINNSDITNTPITNIWVRSGIKLDWTSQDIQTFYWAWNPSDNCSTWKACILKLSVINKLEWKSWFTGWILPYLEWKINLSPDNIPLRYTNIEANWKSFGFIKTLNIRVPQKTTIDAFNFTIFQ